MHLLGVVASGNYVRSNPIYDSISTTTIGAGGSGGPVTLNLSGVTGYKHLQIRALIQTNSNSVIREAYMRFNNDTGLNYSFHRLYAQGSSVAADASGPHDVWLPVAGGSGTQAGSNNFGVVILDILDYANTNKYKTVKSFFGIDANSTGSMIFLASGFWRNTNAITSITFTSGGQTYQQYSQFAVYGIK